VVEHGARSSHGGEKMKKRNAVIFLSVQTPKTLTCVFNDRRLLRTKLELKSSVFSMFFRRVSRQANAASRAEQL
jgi:hypothetical protein